jgi:hypothetical protein
MIHKAKVPPRQRGFIAARGEWKSHRHPMALFYRFDSLASSIASGQIS